MFCVVTLSLLFNPNLYLSHITLSYFVINLSLVSHWWMGSLLCVTLIIINNNNNKIMQTSNWMKAIIVVEGPLL